MAIKLKPKHYGPLCLTSVKAGTLTYTSEAGYQAMAGAPASAELAAPSDLIMAALASCIAISLEMAAQEMKVDPGKIDVEVVDPHCTESQRPRNAMNSVGVASPDPR